MKAACGKLTEAEKGKVEGIGRYCKKERGEMLKYVLEQKKSADDSWGSIVGFFKKFLG
ncbi:MAG: hypothetical protein M1549_03715 [Candidatus Dependentiae bacterium]|nr:hypothetical protein [Candidatus Dependentiae bacterium]